MSNLNSLKSTVKANVFHVLNMTCLTLLRSKIMTKEGVGSVFAVEMWPRAAFTQTTVCTVLFLCSTHNRVKVNAKQTSVEVLVVFSVVWSRLTRVVDIIPTALEAGTPARQPRTDFSAGQGICPCCQCKQKGVRNRCHMRLVGDFRFWVKTAATKCLCGQRQTAVPRRQTSSRTHLSAYTRTRTHTRAGLLQLRNLKREKQHELRVHQVGFKDICRWAATMSVSNGTLPEKAITVHVLN